MSLYVLSKEAASDLAEIARYSIKQFGKVQAKTYGMEFDNCFGSISNNPEMGMNCDHIRPGLRRFEHKNHAIFYLSGNERILIVRVLHKSQKTSLHL